MDDNEVLIKIPAASVNAYDWHLLTADIFLIRLMGGGLLKPKDTRLSARIAGRVEAVDKNIRQFRPDDDVFRDISYGLVLTLPAMISLVISSSSTLNPAEISVLSS